MQVSEYENIYKNEGSHFFYVGNHFVILNLVRQYANGVSHNILDAGCGTGLLAKKLQLFGSVTGVDISPEAIKYAKKRGVNARLASIAKLPFKKALADSIIFSLPEETTYITPAKVAQAKQIIMMVFMP